MAVIHKIDSKVKLSRVNLITTIVSHGWEIYLLMQDDNAKTFGRIGEAKIYNYLIKAKTRLGDILVIVQDSMNELIIIGQNKDVEEKMKQEIIDIIQQNKKGDLYMDRKNYMAGIFAHQPFLTNDEIMNIMTEVSNLDIYPDSSVQLYI